MSDLTKQLKYWRAERPDEWKMDEFLRLAEEQERRIAELEAKTECTVESFDMNKIKADAVRAYVSNSMEAHWILHLNENNLFDRLLINLNEYADKLERGE